MSRSQGRNAVAGATYRHGYAMRDFQTGQTFTNSTHQDVEHCELSIPKNAPVWAQKLLDGNIHENSEHLWNAVERFETRKDAQVYRDVEFSLPHELNGEQRIALARDFIESQFTQRGMVADWCIHNHFDEDEGIEKPHVHVMLTLRELKETPLLEKVKSAFGLESSDIYFGPKVRDWNSRVLLRQWRENWADYANTHLIKAGLDVRIDHRSYAEQGIDLIPQPKLGKSVSEMSERGLYVDRLTEMQAVQCQNQELIRQNPEIVLDYLTRYQTTFTRADIARVLNRYLDNVEEFQTLLVQLETSPKLVPLEAQDNKSHIKYTTQDMMRLEKKVMGLGKVLSQKTNKPTPPVYVEEAIQKGHHQLQQYGGLSTDQVQAIHHMVSSKKLTIVVGHAGSGKTTCLEVAKQVWEQAGLQVMGAAPTGKAAANLEGNGIPSQTLHRLEQSWQQRQNLLSPKTILVVDEAGMVDHRRFHTLLTQAEKQGFSLVLVGDPEQLPPIEAGAPLRALMETIGFAELSTIVRQQKVWQREASHQLATLQTESALQSYAKQGRLYHGQSAHTQLIHDWKESFLEKKLPGATSLILAYTNEDVQKLNELARYEARQMDLLKGPDHLFIVSKVLNVETLEVSSSHNSRNFQPKLIKHEKPFAVGDSIVFLRNDYNLNVRNGETGKILDIQEGIVTIQRNDDTPPLTFDIGTYNHIDHGYATTIHKSQGATVDKTFVYASPLMNQHLTYVALTRHRQDVKIYADTETFPTQHHLFEELSKKALKENVLDYQDSLLHLTPDDHMGFINRRFLGLMSTSYEAAKLFTQKIWAKAEQWMSIYTDLKPEPTKEQGPLPTTFDKVQQVAEKYGLQSYVNPNDPTHGVYMQFAQQFDPMHEKNSTNDDKTILTGIAHHFLTTLERSTGSLDENRLKETYHKATHMAQVFQSHLETHKQTLGMMPALRQVNQMIYQENHHTNHLDEHTLTTLKHQILQQEQSHQEMHKNSLERHLNHTSDLRR